MPRSFEDHRIVGETAIHHPRVSPAAPSLTILQPARPGQPYYGEHGAPRPFPAPPVPLPPAARPSPAESAPSGWRTRVPVPFPRLLPGPTLSGSEPVPVAVWVLIGVGLLVAAPHFFNRPRRRNPRRRIR